MAHKGILMPRYEYEERGMVHMVGQWVESDYGNGGLVSAYLEAQWVYGDLMVRPVDIDTAQHAHALTRIAYATFFYGANYNV